MSYLVDIPRITGLIAGVKVLTYKNAPSDYYCKHYYGIFWWMGYRRHSSHDTVYVEYILSRRRAKALNIKDEVFSSISGNPYSPGQLCQRFWSDKEVYDKAIKMAQNHKVEVLVEYETKPEQEYPQHPMKIIWMKDSECLEPLNELWCQYDSLNPREDRDHYAKIIKQWYDLFDEAFPLIKENHPIERKRTLDTFVSDDPNEVVEILTLKYRDGTTTVVRGDKKWIDPDPPRYSAAGRIPYPQ